MNQNVIIPESIFPVTPRFKKIEITCMKVVCNLFSIFSYMADVSLDILVAYRLFQDNKFRFFTMTVLLIVVPAVVMAFFTMWWYVTDESIDPFKSTVPQWIIRIIFILFLMAPVLRNFEALYFAIKSTKRLREKDNCVRRMVYENIDSSMLRLFEAFMECAPQVVLQLYIFGQGQIMPAFAVYILPEFTTAAPNHELSEIEIIQLICVFTSLLSMACAVSSYQTNLRESLDYKNDLDCSVGVFPFVWRFCELTARLVTLGLFASVFIDYVSLLFVIHTMVMFVFVRIISTDICGNKPGEFLYNFALCYMYFFCFVNPKDDPTKIRYIFYYSVMFVENTVLISVWYTNEFQKGPYKFPVFIMVLVCFSLAILIMLFHYIFLHPTRGKFFGRPCPIKLDDTLAQLQSIAEGGLLHEEIVHRIRKQREEIAMMCADEYFQNVRPKEGKSEAGERQSSDRVIAEAETEV